MIILDINETRCAKKNIIECKTEDELILYLKCNLLSQALNKGKIIKGYSIVITDVEEKDYTLNIGRINNDNVEEKIPIPFCLENVIQYFSKKKEGKYELNYNINFENIVISYGLCIQNLNFNGSVYFRNTTLQSNLGFYDSNFNKLLVFSYSNFYQRLPLEFDNIEFNNMLSFAYCNFDCRVEIKNSKFNGISFFIRNTFHSILIFSKKCELNNIICFYISNFKSNLEFKNTTMNTIMYFRGSTINKLLFNKIEFNDNNSILSIDNNFIKNNFYDSLFNYLLEDEKKEILKDVNKKNNEINKMHFYNIRITGKIDLQNIEVEEADFKGSVINGGLINPVNFKVHKFANRESALFLKQQAYARNNAIDALEYKAKEVELHKDDLIKNWKNNKNLKTLGDILSIELSSIYSDNGQNWVKAFIITLLTNLTFFGFYFSITNTTWHFILSIFIILLLSVKFIKKEMQIYVYLLILIISGIVFGKVPLKIIYDLSIGQNLTSNFIYNFFFFLNPTDYKGLEILLGQNYIKQFFSGICYFLGKIAFWYGSVQTVTAFRKFAKGS
ncbi:hypothetical protein BFL38_07855 [Brachyspira hampsonii]|uniref:Pentapeptide repeat-containing protein n=1 Tax=Brachyspira hampsonii TaxID=1287055 RepID=A0A1E5NF35_9SPIR|nr:hypothetical protein [Brachyspira hampsonii]OEJ14746.1 hypothetical protein BFL38_07855 [Brachyspira hampsonii]